MPPTSSRSKELPDQKPGNWGLAFSFPVTHRPKARRTSTRRVRTGCITCRKRHVKCDEAKPSCQRCLKRHGFCEGYSQDSTSPTTDKGEDQGAGSVVLKGKRPSLPNKPSEILFTNQADQDYFSIWARMSNILDGGLFSPDLYSTYMYQVAHQEPCLRHAIVALGSMRMALQSTDLSQEAFGAVVKQSPHYRNAVSHYARAMRLVYSLSNDERGTRNAILCCILFIAFEALNHNHASAMQHFHHGQSILRHYIAQAQDSLRNPSRAAKSLSPVSEESSPDAKEGSPTAKEGSPPLPKEGSPPLATEGSPVPRVISHDVIQFFYHLDVHVWLRSMMQPQEPTRGLMMGFMDVEDPSNDMPLEFATTEEARNWLGLVQLFAAHFSRHLAELRVPLTKKARKNGTQLPVLCDVPNWRELKLPYAGALTRWSSAFHTIYQKTRQERTTNTTAYLQVTHMQIMYLFTYVAISCAFFSDYSAMRNEEPRFIEMLDLCEDVLNYTPKTEAEPFTLNNGPVVALFIVTTKSRYHATRARAVELLRQFPRRDGLWDSRAVLAIGEWNNMLERTWDEAGVTPEEHFSKLKERNATVEHNEGPRIFVHAPRRHPVTGAWYNKSEILAW